MAIRPKYSEQKIIEIVGYLDEVDGRKVIIIEQKDDDAIIINLEEVVEMCMGQMISLKSAQDLDD